MFNPHSCVAPIMTLLGEITAWVCRTVDQLTRVLLHAPLLQRKVPCRYSSGTTYF